MSDPGTPGALSLVAVSGEILPPKETLQELLERANHEHGLVEEALGQALGHVIECGDALAAIRRDYDHQFKGWESWVEENFDGGRVVASYYMRLAEHKELVSGLPNVSQALKRLRGMPALRRPGYRGYDEEVREEARALVATGMSYAEIGRMLGISPTTVKNWAEPEALRRSRARSRAYSKKQREERANKKKEAAQRAAEREARRVGGALAEAYSLLHKLEAPLAIAERQATDPKVKWELSEAGRQYRRTLYCVVRALGAS